ncbi:MAG: prolyl oligopeptidase family serine peptidase [Aphanocapsa sp. GSE-SYN-MK-11-07L]|jgi:prolyl oligopeptidase|nr:prolyl oligopeptidase family serine peptidase [Aphanocapsa sp. GSE-SYN-MK-11-07L]
MSAKFTYTYPISPTVEQVDDYHGTLVSDPYRWLEEGQSPATQDWITAQNQLTFDFLAQIPARSALTERLTQLWNYEKYSPPFRRGSQYFYLKNDGLQNQSVLYTLPDLEAEPQVLLDPNQLSSDGTIALSGLSLSEDGQWMAYGLSTAGSDWQVWQVKEVATGKDIGDRLQWVKFSGASWSHHEPGFFYSRYDEPDPNTSLAATNYHQKLFFHRLGTPQTADRLIYDRPDQPEWGFNGTVSEDGRYLVISVWRGSSSQNLLFYKDLANPDSPVVELVSEFKASYQFIGNAGSVFWLQTDLEAPRGRVIAIDTAQPAQRQEIIPEAAETLEGVSLINHQFVAAYLKDAHAQVKIFDLKGKFERQVALPGLGSVGGFGGRQTDTETFYSFTSFTVPTCIYRYDMLTGKSSLFRQPQIDFDPQAYETRQVFYRSKDGTKIPLFITHKKGIKLEGRNPTYLYGYGGFNISLTPSFSVSNLVWMELGGVYAVPSLRGGGEYGEDWHQAGMKGRKQNVFDDFVSAAVWLIDQRYTCPTKLAIGGGSNGGLLVGACMTQHPDLFAAALPAVGVMDMLRFHQFTIGWAWVPEYGCADDPEEFAYLYDYSPLHNLQSGMAYPATLITTADHDDRVVPAHSFKFAAALQAAQRAPRPVLIRIETKAGHGAGKPTSKAIDEMGDRLAFLVHTLGIHFPDLNHRYS